MSVRKSSYSNYDKLNGEGQKESPVLYNREEAMVVVSSGTNDDAASAGASPDDLKRDCEKYLQAILNNVGKVGGKKKPMMIVLVGKTKN